MSAKFVIGLTDLESESFIPNYRLLDESARPELDDLNPDRDAYNLMNNIELSIEKATIEWQLDYTLPAVTNLINVYKIIKSNRLHMMSVIYTSWISSETRLVNADIFVELTTLIPVTGIDFPLYTDTDYDNISTDRIPVYGSLELDSVSSYERNGINIRSTLDYAQTMNTTDLLSDSPAERVVYPAFTISFVSNSARTPTKTMSISQKSWMLSNNDVLESKGYYISDNKTKTGGLVIGDLIGNYEDAFEKIQTYNKVCRIDIVED
jgi:hypothetical protein